jgi:hypothetical protein
MKIIRFNLKNLRNGEWFGFFTLFKGWEERFGKKNLGIEDLYDQFILLYEKISRLMEVLRKSALTRKIKEADRQRDKLFRGVYGVVKSSGAHPDAAKRDAAGHLLNLLNKYKLLILNRNMETKSAAAYNLLQDLHGTTYAGDVSLLALAEWITGLEKAEQNFQALDAERTNESIDKPKEYLQLFRSETDSYYTAMINILDARLLGDKLGGDIVEDSAYTGEGGPVNVVYQSVIALNEIVKKHRNLLARRSGHKSRETDDSPES